MAMVDAEMLRTHLVSAAPSAAVVAVDGAGWSVLLPGLPLAGWGDTFDGAVDDVIVALRDYAAAWDDRLAATPNHRHNWPLVTLVGLSTDSQLRAWLLTGR
jgi:hypothetical protein